MSSTPDLIEARGVRHDLHNAARISRFALLSRPLDARTIAKAVWDLWPMALVAVTAVATGMPVREVLLWCAGLIAVLPVALVAVVFIASWLQVRRYWSQPVRMERRAATRMRKTVQVLTVDAGTGPLEEATLAVTDGTTTLLDQDGREIFTAKLDTLRQMSIPVSTANADGFRLALARGETGDFDAYHAEGDDDEFALTITFPSFTYRSLPQR